ncbi:PREDICTED: venom allergen 3-like [Vollenhovia emeryi]|uniref:venom allergen 3-like n=1 Tax=Vollenhovia emeryi TaxID=411798 RepID=UPI0005F5652E|nr:PREDICTED: venom allergen 3-like [Vollenhovia emeryi]
MANIFGILCLAMVVKFASISATDYCNLKSCKNIHQIHTMCKYTSSEPAASCTEWSNQGFSDAEKKLIVEKHNQLRQRVASGQETKGNPGPQPAAVSIPDLSWDNELETIAQRWANQCDFNHDKCRNVDRFSVGQNIAMSSSTGKSTPNLENMIQMWYNEVKKFDKNQISPYQFSMKTGHYTQLIWAKTRLIGCGKISYKKTKDWTTHYLVCNYGPSGNYIGQQIYEIKQ